MLISTVVNTRKSLERIIYNAKIEGEKALISSGLAVYTKDIKSENVEEGSAYAQNLPKNTESNPQDKGIEVAPKENWNIETVSAISVGGGNTVPIPKGFYYVGGDLNTGVIISDEEADKYDGTTDKTTWEYTTNLKGNQFIWIPCTEEQYIKSEVWNGTTQKPSVTKGWDKATSTVELVQIRKYEGFYVARYEAGLAETITEFTSTQKHTTTNQVYNKEGIPQSKAGVIPWNFIEWKMAQKNAKNMYNTNSVSSGLITGTQWDVMLKTIVDKTNLTEADLTNSKSWGNYMNNSIEYKGRLARIYRNSGVWYSAAFGGEKQGKTSIYSSDNGDLLTTGASKQTEKYHIFDVAGNLWEYTEETLVFTEVNESKVNILHTIRGGKLTDLITGGSAISREKYAGENTTGLGGGFRVVLYVK